jgi:hypothetical protein
MTESDQKEFAFTSSKGRKIKARFDGGIVSSDAGMTLVREADKRLRLTTKAAKCIDDPRQVGKVDHSVAQLVQQRVYGLACGYEDANDFETLRDDPLWQALCEKDGQLAGKSTLGRFENRINRTSAAQINELFVELFIASFKYPPKQIILDFDATDNPVHGMQEQRFFHGYYDRYCFLPLYVFCGDQLLCAYLRPSNADAAKHAAAILKLLCMRLRKAWPKVQIIFRADSGFCRDRILTWCDRHGIDYCVGVARNPVLQYEAEVYLNRARDEYERTGEKQRIFGAVIYGAKSWKLKRSVIVKAEQSDKGSNPRFIVTSLYGDDQYLYDKIYCARGEMENRIKEQMQLFSTRTSAHRWWANQWRILLSAMAYVLVHYIRSTALGATELAKAQCATIRLKLFKIGALIVRKSRQIRIHLSESYPMQNLFYLVWERLKAT